MKPVLEQLEQHITEILRQLSENPHAQAMVRPAADPKFGDYQANGVMATAKKLKTNPHKLAEQLVEKLQLDDICQKPEIAGPGFINLRLKPEYLADALMQISKDPQNLAIEKTDKPQTVVVDYSGPNIAKQMHVGHLRSTIIGDAIAQMYEFLGNIVIRQNHIGDWGTQFGKVILGLWHICMGEKHGRPLYLYDDMQKLNQAKDNPQQLQQICKNIRDRHQQDWQQDSKESLGDGEKIFHPFLSDVINKKKNLQWHQLLEAYKFVNLLEDIASTHCQDLMINSKKPTAEQRQDIEIPYGRLSQHITTMLQDRLEQNQQEYDAWKYVRQFTIDHCQQIYNKLNVSLNEKHVKGESTYHQDLPNVINDLKEKKLAQKSDGAVCVFPEGFKNKQGDPLPFIVQKSDGAYLYATTDLAAIRHRVNQLKADRLIYVTDARQKLHFQMLEAVARQAGFLPENTAFEHITFGTMLGEDGKPFKTRSGETVKLNDLLDEAVTRANKVVQQKNPELNESQKKQIAFAVGIGAVKYADYSNNRESDYVFSFDKMLALEGNTAPYMQYAYARIKSIERKAQLNGINIETELANIQNINIQTPEEITLAKHLLRYSEAITAAAQQARPNYLTTYLFELAQNFSSFYTNCPVLNSQPEHRPSRILLCDLTAKTIRHGLENLLGIKVVEQM